MFFGLLLGAKPLVAFALVGLAASTWSFLRFPLAVLAAILFVRASVLIPGNVGPIGYAIAFGGGLALILGGHRLLRRPYVAGFLVLIGLGTLSYWYAVDPTETLPQILRLTALLVLLCVGMTAIKSLKDFHRLVAVVLLSAIVPVLTGLHQLATGQLVEREGVLAILGTFQFANGYALFLSLILILGVVVLMEARSLVARLVVSLGLGLVSLCLFLTYSRIVWIGVVVMLALLAILHYRRLVLAAAVCALIVAVAVPSSVGLVEQRFSDLSPSSTSYSNNSLSWRLENWSRMLPWGSERPVTGHGLASYKDLTLIEFGGRDRVWSDPPETPLSGPTGVSAHNDYVKLFVELGVPGVLAWIFTLLALLVALWRARAHPDLRPYATGMFAFMASLVLMSAGDTQQDYTEVMYYVMALCGAVIGASRLPALREGPSA